ncbi:MBL fold metallo-hydrolase [Rhodovarius crocodyli]|uniref:MBL fold metallo-hydrolase n=1 Tax=Rhodovarius crocodyli TaxID=1979269 RepID=A0A437MIZ7_9PROT|nr:MBL fold metallo-hydrolase [Rhodovarius crocodyli]RVT97638.1 MBL fold metallo-hydrolase [Rhodovarius crocodyli]
MKRLQVGDVSITSIIERDGPWRVAETMFPGAPPGAVNALLPQMDPRTWEASTNKMVITYQSFVLRTPHHVILVDTCTGEDKGYPAPMDFPKQPWLDGLKAEGLTVEDVDYVFCTHLHIDHCGWNTVLRDGKWVPTFPNAKYVFHKKEYEFWEAQAKLGDSGTHKPEVFHMNCEPIVAAGQALLVDDDYSLDDTITLIPTPGHSACHCCVNISSKGQRAVITGDLMHHQLQVNEPSWSTIFCHDPLAAAESRLKIFRDTADTPATILPIHFPAPTAGRLKHTADGFRWAFVND